MPVTETLQSAQAFGPSIWFAVFIVVTLVVSAGTYIKYVHLPSKQVAEENSRKLTEVVEKLTVIVGRTDERTTATHDHVVGLRDMVEAIVVAKEYEADAIAKLAERLDVDVSRELAGISSVLKFSRPDRMTNAQPKT
jgi:hypothetical protein